MKQNKITILLFYLFLFLLLSSCSDNGRYVPIDPGIDFTARWSGGGVSPHMRGKGILDTRTGKIYWYYNNGYMDTSGVLDVKENMKKD